MTRRVWPWLRALIGSAILVALLARLGADAFLNGIRLIDGGTVAAALGITLVTTLLSALRWRLVARGLGLPLRPASAVADYYQAQFLNAVLPAGVLGDADRAVRHGRSAGDAGRAIRAVAMERAAGQLVLIVAAAAALLTQSSSVLTAVRDVLPGPEVAIAAAGALTALIALVAWNVRRKRPAILRRTLDDVHRGMLGRGIWPKLTILSAAVLAGYVSLFLVAARAAGSSAPILQLVPPGAAGAARHGAAGEHRRVGPAGGVHRNRLRRGGAGRRAGSDHRRAVRRPDPHCEPSRRGRADPAAPSIARSG